MDTILYRQNILRDCLKNSTIVRDIYDVAIEALEREKKTLWGIFARSPSLYSSIELLQIFVEILKKLKNIADIHACKFESEGFTTFFLMLKKELGDEYFATIRNHLVALKFRNGVLISAELGKGNKGVNYILRKSQENKQSWMERIFSQKPPAYTFYISERDERGARAMSELQDRGIKPVAIALAKSAEHILNFFIMLRTELAFYIGCLNLYQQLVQIECAISFPVPVGFKERRHVFKELYDVCLALTMKQNVVSNDMNADDKNIVIIT
jgi:DNA mismatch repair ATPase MutS